MQYYSGHSDWVHSPRSSSWSQPAGGNASSDCGMLWNNVDNSRDMHHSSAAGYFPPPHSDQRSDTMTHNINLSITMGANIESSKPDGLGLVRYRAPDIDSFIFDHDKGYRFDPSTGLHYDAKSGFFINHELGMLLSWDTMSNTYRRTGDTTTLRSSGKVLPGKVSDASVLQNSSACYDRVIHKRTSGVDSKNYRIRESTSTSRYDSEILLRGMRRSRSRSARRETQPRRGRSRSKSVERRGERPRQKSSGRDARSNHYRMSNRSKSPKPCFKIKRRSRSRSKSSSNLPKRFRSRSRSVERRGGRQSYRCNSKDARRNTTPTLKCCPSSRVPHKLEHSKSLSACSDKRPRTRKTRSRSVESRGRTWRRGSSRDARRSDDQMDKWESRSPEPHFKAQRRSRTQSERSSNLSRSSRSRSKSVERWGERQGYRCNSRDARRNASQILECCPTSRIPHKTENSKIQSASSDKWPRTRQIMSSSLKSRDAIRNDYQTSKSSSQTASLDKAIVQTKNKNKTHQYGDCLGSSPSQTVGRERDVWNRLGPSIKKENLGLGSQNDTEMESQTSVARTVCLVQGSDEENRRQFCRDSLSPMIYTDDESMFDGDFPDIIYNDLNCDEVPCYVESNPWVSGDDSNYDSQPDDLWSGEELAAAQVTPSELCILEKKIKKEVVYNSLIKKENSGTRGPKDSERKIKTARRVHLVRTFDTERNRNQNCDNRPDTIYNVLVHDDGIPDHTEPKPTRKVLVSRDPTCDSQPEDQRSRYEPTANQKALRVKSRKMRNPYSDDSEEDNRMEHTKETDLSYTSKKVPKDDVVADVVRSRKCCSTEARRTGAVERISYSPARLRDESDCVVCCCRSRISGIRNQSRQCPEEVRMSRSRHRAGQMSDFRELRKRSRSRELRRTDDRESQVIHFRESERKSCSWGRSRSCSEGRRSCSILSRRNYNIDGDSSSSLSSSDDERVSKVAHASRRRSVESRKRYERELDKSIYCSPNRVKREPLSKNSNIHKRDPSRIQHDVSRSRETTKRIHELNIHDPSSKRKKLGSRDVSLVDFQLEGDQLVEIGRSNSGPAISQDPVSLLHETKIPDHKGIPESRVIEPAKKSPNQMPGIDPKYVAVDSSFSEDGAPAPTREILEEAPEGFVIDSPLAANGALKPTENKSEETVVIHQPLPKNEAQKPREETPDFVVITDQNDQPFPEHGSAKLDAEVISQNGISVPSEENPNERSANVVMGDPMRSCDGPPLMDSNPECSPNADCDRQLTKDGVVTPSAKPSKKACEMPDNYKLLDVNDEKNVQKLHSSSPLESSLCGTNRAHKSAEKSPEKLPTVVLHKNPTPDYEGPMPVGRAGTPVILVIDNPGPNADEIPAGGSEVDVIEIDDEPTKQNPEGVPEIIEIDDEPVEGNSGDKIIDNGDVLGHLFANSDNAPTNIVLVAPLPRLNPSKNASDDLKDQIGQPKDVLRVHVSNENTSGSPWCFMLVSFKTPFAAKQWHDSLGGTVVLNDDAGSKSRAYFHFLKRGNWNCKHCKSFNFFMQSLCSKCYQSKNDEFSPVSISKEPTTCVGIAKLKSSFSTTQSVTESLPSLHSFNILSVEMMSEPSGPPLGLCVFEVESKEEGSRLHEFFQQQERNAVYVVMNEEPKTPDEEYLTLLFEKTTPTSVILVAVIPLSDFPDIRFDLSSIKTHLLMLLKEDGVRYKKISFHVDKNVGAPYSYVLVTFADTKTAAQWLKSRRRTINSLAEQNPSPSSGQPQKFKVALHFSKDNWKCPGCPVRNFPLRSLCHSCFKHREPNKRGSVSQSSTPTPWVAIPVLSNWSKTDECIVAEFRELLKEFILKRVEVIRDSECPSLPLACAIEMQGNSESLRLRDYLTNEGRNSMFVLFHEETDERVIDLSNDVMIVESPPPECIDLTTEVNTPPTTSNTEESPPETVDLTSDRNLSQNTQEGGTSSPEKQPLFSENITNEVNFSQSGIISVSPVPRLGGNTQWQCALAFLNYGAEYESVHYCQGNLFGVSYNYCLVHFSSPDSAKEWYTKCQGYIEITNKTFPNIKRKGNAKIQGTAHLNFSEKNWLCDCGKENCHVRSICFSCFKRKGAKVPILVSSSTPTKYLAVKLVKKYAVAELAAIFPEVRCTAHDVVNIKFIGDPKVRKDNFGIIILETKFLEGAIALRNYYKTSLVVRSTSYVVMKDPNAGTIIYLGFSPAVRGTQNVGSSGMDGALDKPRPDYASIIWMSLYGILLDKPSSNVVMIPMCLEHRELPVETRAQIQDSLKYAGVTCESLLYSFKRDVGSPFSYCLISFDSTNSAKTFFEKCKDTFLFEICRPDDHKLPRSFQNCFSLKKISNGTSHFLHSKLHYSQSDWTCNCGTSNFPLRSVCHACFKSKNRESGYSVSEATKFVGIKLTESLETDISSLYDIRDFGYNVSKINIGLDPAIPRDPCGIIIFEMHSLNEGIKFRQFLAKVASCLKNGQNRNYDPIVQKFMKILWTSSGVTFLVPYLK